MAKKKKEETIEDVLDRIEEDLQKVRDKVWEMEPADEEYEDEDSEDEDEEEDDN
jgi:hypothetical protein